MRINRSKVVTFRMTEPEHGLVTDAANKLSLYPSEFMRDLLVKEAKRVLRVLRKGA